MIVALLFVVAGVFALHRSNKHLITAVGLRVYSTEAGYKRARYAFVLQLLAMAAFIAAGWSL